MSLNRNISKEDKKRIIKEALETDGIGISFPDNYINPIQIYYNEESKKRIISGIVNRVIEFKNTIKNSKKY